MARLKKAPAPPAEQPERDRNLDPWRRPSSEAAQALVAEALALFAAREAELGQRQRKRRPRDQAVMEETVAALVCDALHRELARPGGRVMVPLSNQVLGARNRYRAPVLSKVLPDILTVLSGPVLTMEKGRKGYFDDARRTTIALSPAFIERARALALGFADLRKEPGGEVIILKASKGDDGGDGVWEDYPETSETRRFRTDMERINAFLAAADIEVHPFDTAAERADPRDRHLRRIFNNGCFDHGGRLFGGFWQWLPKKARREAITIDEDGITELDFRQMAPRLLYARAGVLPPDDCYAVPGFEQYRDGWKKRKRGSGAVLSVGGVDVVVGPGAGGFGLALWMALTTTRRASVIGGLRF